MLRVHHIDKESKDERRRQHLAAGASKVYATARSPQDIDPQVAANPSVRTLALDITDQASADAAAHEARDVTLLVNNAGVLGFGGILDGDLDRFQRDLTTNYLGTLRVARAFVPVLEANAPAAIANVLTLIALAPVPGMAATAHPKLPPTP